MRHAPLKRRWIRVACDRDLRLQPPSPGAVGVQDKRSALAVYVAKVRQVVYRNSINHHHHHHRFNFKVIRFRDVDGECK